MKQIKTDCDGCTPVAGRLFSGCSNCEIRTCAIGKKLKSCAFCSDFACEKLEKHFLHRSGCPTTAGRNQGIKLNCAALNFTQKNHPSKEGWLVYYFDVGKRD